MEPVVNVDMNLESSDWIKSGSWSFTEVQTLEDLISMVAGPDVNEEIQKKRLLEFMDLPAAVPMPDQLRRDVYAFLGKRKISPSLFGRLVWCARTAERFFPEEGPVLAAVVKRIKENKTDFFEDLDFEDQAVILSLETKKIDDKTYPKSYLDIQISKAAQSRK